MNASNHIWDQLNVEERKLFVNRLVNNFNFDHTISFINGIIKTDIHTAIDEIVAEYRKYLSDNLYTTGEYSLNEINAGALRDIFFIIEDDSTVMHIIMDEVNEIVHINCDRLSHIKDVSNKLFRSGNILTRLSQGKNTDIFKFRFYRAYKIIGKVQPLEVN